MYHLFKEPGRLGVIERVSEMISEKESYEEIGTGSIYNETTIADQIHTKWAGKTVHFARETDSTNLWIKRLAKEGASEGTLALAEFQSAGRGRLGRSWEVPEGTSVMMSILLRPKFEPQYAPTLTLVMGMAVAKAVKNLGFDVSIKWPNDVLCSEGKLAGISLEALAGGVCVGVGVNVYEPFAKREVGGKYSLAYLQDGVVEAGLSAEQRTVMTQVVESMLEAMECRYGRWLQEGFSAFIDEYSQRFAYRNKRASLALINGDETIEGIIRGVDGLGRLLVENDVGIIVPMSSGEVHVTSLQR